MAKGPFLTAAVVCEEVRDAETRTPSLIRVSSWTVGWNPNGPVAVKLDFFVQLFAGGATGSFPLRIEVIGPTKAILGVHKQTTTFSDPEDVKIFRVTMVFESAEAGLHHFDVYVGTRMLTRAPLWIRHERPMPVSPGLH